jgi:hypothetical protein
MTMTTTTNVASHSATVAASTAQTLSHLNRLIEGLVRL